MMPSKIFRLFTFITYCPREIPTGYVGQDYFEYSIFDGLSLSPTAYVCLDVDNSIGIRELKGADANTIHVFPNPAKDVLNLKCQKEISELSLFSAEGKLIKNYDATGPEISVNVSELSTGIYYLKTRVGDKTLLNRFNKTK